MVRKSYDSNRLIELDSNEGERKSMKDQFLTAKKGCLTLYRREWRIRLSQQLNSMLKDVCKAVP